MVALLNERNADVIFRPRSAKTILANFMDNQGIGKINRLPRVSQRSKAKQNSKVKKKVTPHIAAEDPSD
jgi:hypothetical protein